jgi:hypothetical protein
MTRVIAAYFDPSATYGLAAGAFDTLIAVKFAIR